MNGTLYLLFLLPPASQKLSTKANSYTIKFWKCYDELPIEIKKQAREAYRLFQHDPYHPGLHFKRIHPTEPVFSARISRNYRSVGIVQGDEIIWFWIGPHDSYMKLIGGL